MTPRIRLLDGWLVCWLVGMSVPKSPESYTYSLYINQSIYLSISLSLSLSLPHTHTHTHTQTKKYVGIPSSTYIFIFSVTRDKIILRTKGIGQTKPWERQ